MKNKLFLGIIFTLISMLCFASAEVYDDFSGSSLDTSLWTESADSTASADLDEYGLDTTNQNYHMAQNTLNNNGRMLLLTQEFQAGDTLTYEVNYQSGSGNIISREYINGNYLDLIIGTSLSYPEYATTGVIGYWNGNSEVGNDLGTYYVSVTFNDDSADFEITNPNGIIWNYTATGLTAPYSYGVSTRTGHDGLGHFDYDNFEVLNTEEEPVVDEPEVNATELQERLGILETQVNTLETTVIDLQTQIDNLESISNNHEQRITNIKSLLSAVSNRVNILWRIVGP